MIELILNILLIFRFLNFSNYFSLISDRLNRFQFALNLLSILKSQCPKFNFLRNISMLKHSFSNSSLYLVDVMSGEKQLLLPKALFVQWVIQSDVVVAQTDNNLEIWYNIDMPEHKTLMPVRGEVTEIVRENVRQSIIKHLFVNRI